MDRMPCLVRDYVSFLLNCVGNDSFLFFNLRFSKVDGPHQKLSGEIYAKLRKNVIDNIVSEYWRTGYIWEHYNDVTGYGEGTHPFTGWSALVVAIMGEKYH